MRTALGTTLITNGQMVDGNGGPAVPDAAVVVVDGRITYAGPVAGAPELPPDAGRIDARGGTILPGLVEAHFHPTYFDVAALADLDIKYPVEYVTILAAAVTPGSRWNAATRRPGAAGACTTSTSG